MTAARDLRGQVWAAWEADSGPDSEIYFSRWTGGAWSAAEPVLVRPDAWDRQPSLAIAADGTPWLAWTSAARSDPDHRGIYVSRWSGGRWGEPQAVPLGGATLAKQPALAAAPDGTLWLAWSGFDGVDDAIYASRRVGRSWPAPQQVSAADGSLYDLRPSLAVGGDGRPWLVWTGHQASPDGEIYASRWTGAGWSAEQTVSRDDAGLDVSASLALDAAGRPWVAWVGQVPAGERPRRRIMVSRWDPALSPAGGWTAEEIASSPAGLPVEERMPALGLDDQGQMHLVWLADAGSTRAVAHSRRQEGAWTQPEVIDAGVPAQAVSVVGGERQPAILWLDPAAAPQGAPLRQATAGGESGLPEALAGWIASEMLPTGAAAIEGEVTPEVDSIPNRFLAFGDSITRGYLPETCPGCSPYPLILDIKLDDHIRPMEVINAGVDGETTWRGRNRIGGEVGGWLPKYILIMEGTNDATQGTDPDDVYWNLDEMVYNARHAGEPGNYVSPVKLMIATIIPRLDGYEHETQVLNDEIKRVAADKNQPLCDQHKAFEDYGNYGELYIDDNKHPNQGGMQLLADTFYGCILATWNGDIFPDVTPPPTVNLTVVSPTACGSSVNVSWSGSDNADGTGVVNYDVQVRIDGGPWTDWLMGTAATQGWYGGVMWGHTYYFQVRARDRAGNVSAYTAPASSAVVDNSSPSEAHVNALPAVSLAPFTVSWGGSDACSSVTRYDVQAKAGSGIWQNWLTGTTNSSAAFNPSLAPFNPPQYGLAYAFRVCAYDQNPANPCTWSNSVSPPSTILARYGQRGQILTVREQPVVGAAMNLVPAALSLVRRPSGYMAYLPSPAIPYLLTVGSMSYGALFVPSDNPDDLNFYLTPADDVVLNGDFEPPNNLTNWQTAGSLPPTIGAPGHTGSNSAQLGGTGETSEMSQGVTLPPGATDPTLSFMFRLANGAAPDGSLQVTLSEAAGLNAPAVYTVPVTDDTWSHFWVDLTGMSSALTIALSVSNGSAVLVDEVSVGSALPGGYLVHLPVIRKQ